MTLGEIRALCEGHRAYIDGASKHASVQKLATVCAALLDVAEAAQAFLDSEIPIGDANTVLMAKDTGLALEDALAALEALKLP